MTLKSWEGAGEFVVRADATEARLVEGEVGFADGVVVLEDGLVGIADGKGEGWRACRRRRVDAVIVGWRGCGC